MALSQKLTEAIQKHVPDAPGVSAGSGPSGQGGILESLAGMLRGPQGEQAQGPAGEPDESLLRSAIESLIGPKTTVSEFQGGEEPKRSKTESGLEKIKFALDMIGVVDPTGIADLTSAGISAGQGVHALATGKEGAGRHFFDAGVSAFSALPGGDLAKVAKLPKYIKESKSLGRMTKRGHDAARLYKREQLGGIGKVAAAGGGTFVADHQMSLTIGEQGPEHVQVTPLGKSGQTTFSQGAGRMAGGGGLIAGQAEGEVIHGMAESAAKALSGGFAGLAKEVVTLPLKIRDWSDALLQSKQHLADFSLTIAQSFAETEMRDVQRNIKSGEDIGGSVAALADAQADLKDSLQPMRDSVTIGLNLIVEKAVRGVDILVKIANAVVPVEAIRDTLKDMASEDDDKMGTLGDFLNKLEDEGARQARRRIPRR